MKSHSGGLKSAEPELSPRIPGPEFCLGFRGCREPTVVGSGFLVFLLGSSELYHHY